MRGGGFIFLLGCLLVWFGWRMVRDNYASLRRRESMYSAEARFEAAWSGLLMAIIGGVILAAGLAILGAMVRTFLN
jgi:hypothetical protein